MYKIYSIEERVLLIVKDFMDNINLKEPFVYELSQYRFRLRAKLLEILNQLSNDTDIANKSFNSALEGIERYLEERINRIDLNSEEETKRVLRALEETNVVLKEFLYKDIIKDKSTLSRVSGKIGQWTQAIELEVKGRFGGILRRIKKLFGR